MWISRGPTQKFSQARAADAVPVYLSYCSKITVYLYSKPLYLKGSPDLTLFLMLLLTLILHMYMKAEIQLHFEVLGLDKTIRQGGQWVCKIARVGKIGTPR